MPIDAIKHAIASLPLGPGVYRMINAAGKDLYIGKAKNIQKRVTHYTQWDRLSHRLKQMVNQVDRVGVITTNSELEALLLEAQLIKRHKPTYNILLKNDNPLVYLALSKHVFPRLHSIKSRTLDGESWTIGPFLSHSPLQSMIDIVQKGFLLRSCSDAVFAQRTRPCLQYHIGRCSAPCVDKITPADYTASIESAKGFLTGKMPAIQDDLKQKLYQYVHNHAYDQAVIVRDQIQAMAYLMPSQISASAGKSDIIAWAYQSGKACIHVTSWRDGATYGCETFFWDECGLSDGPTILLSFLQQFYGKNQPPPRLILPFLPDDWSDFCMVMRHSFQHVPHGIVPKRGPLKSLLEQAQNQAQDALTHYCTHQGVQNHVIDQATVLFSWPKSINRIEIYDNSHLQGTHATAVMVVHNGYTWDKKAYRTWSMDSNDDYDMMRQVMMRRFYKSRLPLPDALIIDGGKGQLSAVQSALDQLNLTIPCISIAKTLPHDMIVLHDHTPMVLPEHHPVLHWVQSMRDEAHRFAINTHRRKRDKAMITGTL
ncbi:MAG: excinuclease ABC subunit UvrC [Alphaproteobacteria bacterium]|nr:excinuclease ABC subunit UvrC [Alphaproteobacteria bacterium]